MYYPFSFINGDDSMKQKLLVSCLLMTLFISSTTFSFQIISEETKVSSGAKGYVERSNPTFGEITPEIKKNSPKQMNIHVRTYNAEGKVNSYVRLNSNHDYCLYNYSSQSIQGGYRFEIVALRDSMLDAKTFILKPNEYYCTGSTNLYMTSGPLRSGQYKINALTRGQDGGSTNDVNDSATLKVT